MCWFFPRNIYSWFLLLSLRVTFFVSWYKTCVDTAQTQSAKHRLDICLSTFFRQNWCFLGKPISDILETPILKYLLLCLLSSFQTISHFWQHSFSKASCSDRFLCYTSKVLIMLPGFILQVLKEMSLDIFPVRK